jgi:hypothetical protein
MVRTQTLCSRGNARRPGNERQERYRVLGRHDAVAQILNVHRDRLAPFALAALFRRIGREVASERAGVVGPLIEGKAFARAVERPQRLVLERAARLMRNLVLVRGYP